MMEDDLPTNFDVVVVGTGMVESIVAAAASRIGKNVLHLDTSDHYGGLWASYNFDGLQKFIKEVNSDPKRQAQVYNLVEKWHIDTDTPEGPVEPEPKVEESSGECEGDGKTEEKKESAPVAAAKKIWSKAAIAQEYRKFNIDLTPKLLFSRGPLVELLISSNIARYAEFRCVTRVLTWLDGRLALVPCSRADVFATSDVSIVEKRMLMKLLTAIVNYTPEQMDEEFKEFKDKPFRDYLKSKQLSENCTHYVLYAIAGGSASMPCLEGVRECKKFLMSLGRYGNTPFLWPMYGSGELPQCFCRLCAVYGGVYCLNRPIDKVYAQPSDDGEPAVAIDTRGKTLRSAHLVIGVHECPSGLLQDGAEEGRDISKAVFVTERSMLASEKEPLTLLRFPPLGDSTDPVTALEVGSATGSCPKGLFVVYFICKKTKDAETDLMPYAEKILNMSGASETDDSKPKCLWSLFYNVKDRSAPAESSLPRVHLCSGPDVQLDFDGAVQQAEAIFRRICPDEEFLPRAPDPEEIVFDDDAPPGPEFSGDSNDGEDPAGHA